MYKLHYNSIRKVVNKLTSIIPITLRLKEETHKRIEKIAENQERSKNKQIEFILNQFIKEYEKVNGKIDTDN